MARTSRRGNRRPRRANWSSDVPITYVIQGGFEKLASAEFQAEVAKEPPTVFHVQHLVPICSVWGPFVSWEGASPPEPGSRLRADADEVKQKVEDLRSLNGAYGEMGVTLVPYINNQAIGGDHTIRTGFWEFYDHWDDYAELGLGPRPAEDPVTWLKRDRRQANFAPYYLYHPCPNHPAWQRFMVIAAELAARAGMRAIFVDENTIYHYGECCRQKFKKWLAETHDPAALQKWFGTSDPERLELAGAGQGRRWVETQRFWSQSNTNLLNRIQRAGRRHSRGFWATPNLGPMAHCDGVVKRAILGMDAGTWASVCELIMFEEMLQPGLFAPGYVYDHQLQYKLAYAEGFRAGILSYRATTPGTIAIGMAEASAYGGGCLQQCGFDPRGPRDQFARFWRDHAALFKGYRSYAQVALCFDYDELYWENSKHLEAVYRIRQHLADRAYLFDVVVPEQWNAENLRRYKAVILPCVEYLGDAAAGTFKEYGAAGGTLIITPETGRKDDDGSERPDGLAGQLGEMCSTLPLDSLVPPRPFEIFLQEEETVNDVSLLKAACEAAYHGDAPEPTFPPTPLDALLGRSLEGPTTPPTGEEHGAGSLQSPGGPPYTVRVAAWLKKSPKRTILMLHFVNYDMPFQSTGGDEQPRPTQPFLYRVPLPEGQTPLRKAAKGFSPELSAPVRVPFDRSDDALTLHVPSVGAYLALRIELTG